jgi:hypothetical protein
MKSVYVVLMWDTQSHHDEPAEVELFNSKTVANMRASEYTGEDQDSCTMATVTLMGIQ